MRRGEGQPNSCRLDTNPPSAARPPSLPLHPCIHARLSSEGSLLSSLLSLSTPAKQGAALSYSPLSDTNKTQPTSIHHPSLTQKERGGTVSCLPLFSVLTYSAGIRLHDVSGTTVLM